MKKCDFQNHDFLWIIYLYIRNVLKHSWDLVHCFVSVWLDLNVKQSKGSTWYLDLLGTRIWFCPYCHFCLRFPNFAVCTLQVEGMNCLVSELADVAAQERAMLDESEALLASTAAMQVRPKFPVPQSYLIAFIKETVSCYLVFTLLPILCPCRSSPYRHSDVLVLSLGWNYLLLSFRFILQSLHVMITT